jgi:hypothetical protein
MVEADGFDSNQRIAWSQWRQLLYTDIDHFRSAATVSPGHPALNRLIHDESPYYPARYGGAAAEFPDPLFSIRFGGLEPFELVVLLAGEMQEEFL